MRGVHNSILLRPNCSICGLRMPILKSGKGSSLHGEVASPHGGPGLHLHEFEATTAKRRSTPRVPSLHRSHGRAGQPGRGPGSYTDQRVGVGRGRGQGKKEMVKASSLGSARRNRTRRPRLSPEQRKQQRQRLERTSAQRTAMNRLGMVGSGLVNKFASPSTIMARARAEAKARAVRLGPGQPAVVGESNTEVTAYDGDGNNHGTGGKDSAVNDAGGGDSSDSDFDSDHAFRSGKGTQIGKGAGAAAHSTNEEVIALKEEIQTLKALLWRTARKANDHANKASNAGEQLEILQSHLSAAQIEVSAAQQQQSQALQQSIASTQVSQRGVLGSGQIDQRDRSQTLRKAR